MKSSSLPALRDILVRVFVVRQAFLALLITLALILAAYQGGQALARRQVQETRLLAHNIHTYLEHAGRVLHAVAEVSLSPQDMDALRTAYGYFDVLYRLDTQGKLVAISPVDPQFPPGMDLSAQPYYQSAQTDLVVSQPFISIRTGNPTIYLTHPLSDGQGMIVGELSLIDLQKTVIISNEALSGTYIITDRDGRLLAHPNYALVRQQADIEITTIIRRERAAQTHPIYWADGHWMSGISIPVESVGWFAINQTRASTVYGPFLLPLALGGILASLMGILFVWQQQVVVNREVIHPLSALSQEAELLAAGDFPSTDYRVSAPSVYEEIHSLDHSFQRMKQAIQSREVALLERLTFETLLSELSAAFVNVPVDVVDPAIDHWLQQIATFIGTDSCALLEFSDDESSLRATYAYSTPGSPSILVSVLSPAFSWYIGTLKRGESVVLNTIDDLPEEAVAERSYAMQGLIFSHAAIPLNMSGRPFGAIGLADFHVSRIWSETELQRLRLMGEVLMTAVVRKRSEEERERLLIQIRERARQVQQIMDTVPEGVIVLDDELHIRLANPTGEGDLSTLAKAQVGDKLTHLGPRALSEILTSPPKGLWHEIELHKQIFQVIARPLNVGTTPGGWVIVIRDVTRQREFDQRVQRQERLAAVGQLAAGIAHDFNNIMATIVLYAQMTARAPELSAVARSRMETINQQAHHATALIQQILDFSRHSVLERQPLDLLPIFKEHAKLLERTLPENIHIKLDYGFDTYSVNADPTRIQQILTNLAVNARDAMATGGTLHFSLERLELTDQSQFPLPEMTPGAWIRIVVTDTGAGIADEVMERLYEPFVTTKEPGKGTGLGLSQVHGIVIAHEGHIDVSTRPGHGTTITIYLPALSKSAPDRPDKPDIRLPMGHGETLLVVEDNPATRRALVESLEALNYEISAVESAEAALALLARQPYDFSLVLSDVVMPGMGGVALVRVMQQRHIGPKVILLTGHPLEKELNVLMAEAPALLETWLSKPVTFERLAQVIAEALGNDHGPLSTTGK